MKPPEPPDIDAVYIFKWIAERIVYFVIVAMLGFGALVAMLSGNQDESETPIPRGQQAILSIFGIMVIALLMYYVMGKYDINPFILFLLSAFLGLGTSKVSYWMLAIWRQSRGFVSFLRIMSRIYTAARKVLKEAETEDKSQPKAP